jgi:hypothetical protein
MGGEGIGDGPGVWTDGKGGTRRGDQQSWFDLHGAGDRVWYSP